MRQELQTIALSTRTRGARFASWALVFAAILVSAGCGGDDKPSSRAPSSSAVASGDSSDESAAPAPTPESAQGADGELAKDGEEQGPQVGNIVMTDSLTRSLTEMEKHAVDFRAEAEFEREHERSPDPLESADILARSPPRAPSMCATSSSAGEMVRCPIAVGWILAPRLAPRRTPRS